MAVCPQSLPVLWLEGGPVWRRQQEEASGQFLEAADLAAYSNVAVSPETPAGLGLGLEVGLPWHTQQQEASCPEPWRVVAICLVA